MSQNSFMTRARALALGLALLPAVAGAARSSGPTRSSTIALAARDRILLVVNRDTDSLAVLRVRRRGADAETKLAEIPVGLEPRCVAADPRSRFAFVTNGVSGTVSVVQIHDQFRVVAEIPVGHEPRGCALTPNGKRLLVANHTDGTISVIDTATRTVVGTVNVGGNPTAIAITDDGDRNDTDEMVFVTQFFSELTPGKSQPFDDARRGVVHAFPSGSLGPVTKITLSPLAASGFAGDRTKFCTRITPTAHSDVFCPDAAATVPNDAITKDPQGAFPNLLYSALIRGGRLYLPNVGSAPEPPVKFNLNIQGLVHVVDTGALAEQPDLLVNLNAQVKAETQPANPTASLDRIFSNDIVAIDATPDGKTFLIVSRGGNYVFKAGLDAGGKLALGLPVVRFQTGNIPDGVVVSRDGKRAYVNNEVNLSVTAIDLGSDTVLARDIPAGTPPAPGTFAHAVLAGKLTFFTALGTPDDGLQELPIRDIVPLAFRNKASDNGWSSCASCHNEGLTDNVTWIFPEGPRNTIALDAFFAKENPTDQRISNWSAIRGSITDFTGNTRAIQGGKGFAGDPPNPNVYNHGITQGASDALDLMTLWVQTVRSPILPQPGDPNVGRDVFETNCAACHGGAKWTKSQVLYADNPTFTADPLGLVPGVPRDPGVMALGGGQIQSYTVGTASIEFLGDAGAFSAANPLEIRGTGGKIGEIALGAAGFNVPSLLGLAYTAPYFHDGSAATLDDVFQRHLLEVGGATTTISAALSAAQRDALELLLNSIDGTTPPFRSAADDFRDVLAGGS